MDLPDEQLARELWTSWASVLRSYAAAHSLGRAQHAVVEVSEREITLRYGSRWLRCTPSSLTGSEGQQQTFHLTVNGHAVLGSSEQPMDLTAERLAREIMEP